MMTFDEAMQEKKDLEDRVALYSELLNGFPKNEDGLVAKETRERPDWQLMNKEYQLWFQDLQEWNKLIMRLYKKEYLVWRKENK